MCRKLSNRWVVLLVVAILIVPPRAPADPDPPVWAINNPTGEIPNPTPAVIACNGTGPTESNAYYYLWRHNGSCYVNWGSVSPNDLYPDEGGAWSSTAYPPGDEFFVGDYRTTIGANPALATEDFTIVSP